MPQNAARMYDRKLFEFPVLYVGWEMDNKAWIAEKDGKRVLVMTSHGGEYIAEKTEIEDKIKEYRHAIEQSTKALEMLR